MKRTAQFGCLLMASLFSLSNACFDPQSKFYSGVLFNGNETIDLAKLESFGADGVNYIKQCDAADLCNIRYRGHYGENTLVHLGHYAPPMSGTTNFPRIVVALDTTTTPSFSEKALAVAAELTWLADNGIIRLSARKIDTIRQQLEKTDGQFWTYQGKTLPYNSWFIYDTVTHSWKTTGVNGVYSVDGVKGGCGANINYGLPPKPLSTTGVTSPKTFQPYAPGPSAGGTSSGDVYSLQGKKIARFMPCRPGIYLIRDQNMRWRRMAPTNSTSR